MNVSIIVALRNNLEYTKHFYSTTRNLYPEVEICFSSYSSTDGTHAWLEDISLTDKNVKTFYSNEDRNFSDNYNKAVSLATNEYVLFAHNDMVLTHGFLETVIHYLKDRRVVSYTTVEPPIFSDHERPGKIVMDFGSTIDTFRIEEFYEYSKQKTLSSKSTMSEGISFFMCMRREDYVNIGGLDNLYNPMFCEDDDLIKRWKLLGFDTFTALDAICYHFVSKTSRFSEEYKQKTYEIEANSYTNFIRKWGSRTSKNTYDIGLVIRNCNLEALSFFEPSCSNIYISDDMEVIKSTYIDSEQSKTKFDLNKRVRLLGRDKIDNDVIVELDLNELTREVADLISLMPDILDDQTELGKFELGPLKIEIRSLETYQHRLINNNDPFYLSKLLPST